MIHPFEKHRFRQISGYNVSTERDSEKSSPMMNRKSIMGFPTSDRWSACITTKSFKGWLKKDFSLLYGIKVEFNRTKSATQFLCVKTSSSKVVERSMSYEVTKKYRTERVYLYTKCWLRLTYTVVVSTGLLLGVCRLTISTTRPVPVADDATRTRTRPAPKISTHTRPDPRVYPYP